jgi:hypothetical protein
MWSLDVAISPPDGSFTEGAGDFVFVFTIFGDKRFKF